MKKLLKKVNKKLLILRGSGSPNRSNQSFLYAPYFLLAKGLIEKKAIAGADMVFVNAHKHKKYIKVLLDKNISLHFLPQKKDYKNLAKEYEYVFIRGNYKEYPDVLKEIKYRKLIYYAADSRFWPRCIGAKDVDVFLVDSQDQAREVKKKYPKVKIIIFNKLVDEKIFKPKKTKKIYDICFIANFLPWKNHNILLSEIKKTGKNLKTVFVGNLLGQEQRAKTMAWKYGQENNVVFTGLIEPRQVARILNQSKISIFSQELDANPRTLAESLACNIPVLVNKEMTGGGRLVNKQTGKKVPLHKFHQEICWMLKNYKSFKPREFFAGNLTNKKIINNFLNILKQI